MARRALGVGAAAVLIAAGATLDAGSMPVVKITPEWRAKIRGLMPEKARVAPKKARRVLLFSLTTGFDHWVIPHTDAVVELLAEKTGAFEVVRASDIKVFERESLDGFDAVILNNNCSKDPGRNMFIDVLGDDKAKAETLEKNLLEFVAGGKGITLIHGAIVFLNNSPAFSGMVGGSFDFHPAQQEVTLDLVEPEHPLLEAFEAKPFVHVDEPYLFKGAYATKEFRPLLVMDTSKLDCGNQQKRVASDVRYCAWIKSHGKGRVFYCSPSHNAQSFDDPRLLAFLLDGIQYTLGDLGCDDSVRKYGPPAGDAWELVWRDEFDGKEVDDTKWEKVGDGKRRGAYWLKENTTLDGKGHLVVLSTKKDDRYGCGGVRSRGRYTPTFGYYEIRCKVPDEVGTWAAFWLYAPCVGNIGNGGKDGAEIDIFEATWRDQAKVNVALHWDGYGKEHRSWARQVETPGVNEGFHTFGLDWRPDVYVFYYDGKEVARTDAGGVCEVPLYLKVTTEIGEWAGDISKAKLPDAFVVDYVRVYQRVKKAGERE